MSLGVLLLQQQQVVRGLGGWQGTKAPDIIPIFFFFSESWHSLEEMYFFFFSSRERRKIQEKFMEIGEKF